MQLLIVWLIFTVPACIVELQWNGKNYNHIQGERSSAMGIGPKSYYSDIQMGYSKIKFIQRILLLCCFYLIVITLQSCSTEQTVYICTGPKAYAYHLNSDCSLMITNCTGSIKEIQISRAHKMKRKPCGRCANWKFDYEKTEFVHSW